MKAPNPPTPAGRVIVRFVLGLRPRVSQTNAPLVRASLGRLARKVRALGVVAAGFGMLGCAAAPRVKPVPAAQGGLADRPFSAPIASEGVDPTRDAVVRIVGNVSCTGTLIADDLVLTAHHCVSKRDARGHVIAEDVAPESLHVELGGDDFPYAEVRVRTLVSPDCGYVQGEGDIAILVLSRKLVGMPVWTPRLDSPPRVGERADTEGFGRCAANSGPIRRYDRVGGPISAVGAGQIMAQASVCPGDSGGPVFDSHDPNHEILGVISASVMDTTDAPHASYFTRLDVWPQLFSAAHEIADGASASELPPFRSCERRAPGAGSH